MSVTEKPRSTGSLSAPMPAPPVRQFSFTDFQVNNPTSPPPGDRLDAEFDRANNAIDDVIDWTSVSLNTDGSIRDGVIGENNLQSDLFDFIASDAVAEVQPLVDQAQVFANAAQVSALNAQASETNAANAASTANSLAIVAGVASGSATTAANNALASQNAAAVSASHASNSDNDAEGAAALAQDYAVVTQAWAEHMPDPIPPDILSVMGVTGNHWSSRWWAAQAASLVATVTSGQPYLALAGGTMIGPLVLARDPSGNLEAATKQYVDGLTLGATIGVDPSQSTTGPLWWDTNSGQLFIQYDDGNSVQWVPANSTTDTAFDGVSNVVDFGADPTGINDSSGAILIACAEKNPNGYPQAVYLPAGSYRITQPFVLSAGQTLMGDGRGQTCLFVDADFNPAATFIIGVTSAFVDAGPLIKDLTISFNQPLDQATTATATSVVGATQITVADTTNILLGGSVSESTGGTITYPPVCIPRFTTVTHISGNVLTLSQPLIGTVNNGQGLNFGPSRATFAPLGTGTAGFGGTGIRYPWAIRSISSGGSPCRPKLIGVRIQGAWNGIRANVADGPQSATPWLIDTLEIGALNVGLDWAGWKDFGHLDTFHYWPFGLNVGNLYRNVYADYNNYALQLGEIDGLDARGISIFDAAIQIDDPSHYSHWTNLMLDGDEARVIVNNALWVQISNCYSSKSLISQQPTFTIRHADVTINNLEMSPIGGANIDHITVADAFADVQIVGGLINVSDPTSRAAHVTAGRLLMSGMRFAAPIGGSVPFLHQSATGQLQVVSCSFVNGTGPGVTFDNDSSGNMIAATNVRGYTVSVPPQSTLGSYGRFGYQPRNSGGNVILTGSSVSDALPLLGEMIYINAATPAGTGGVLPPSFVGAVITVDSGTQNAVRIYASGSDTIDAIAGATGIVFAPVRHATFYCYQAGQWHSAQYAGVGGYSLLPAASGLVLTGTARADALALTAQLNLIGAATPTGAGGILPLAIVGNTITIYSGTANPIKVYASGVDTIDGIAGATGVTLGAAHRCAYYCFQTGTWNSAQLGVNSA